MAIAAAAVGVAGGAHALWGYNRANFMYDRKMRMEQEFKVMEYRNLQAELWREDVRDIIGLTERRMDSYLIVNTLQLGMCVGLFTEGRLEPGTPPWLLHLYMLTLGAAFMYLLMSVWLALHAMVVAQCSSVRLLTQFVRKPIPTWEQLEAVRTYASSFEELGAGQMLRVPFVGARAGERDAKTSEVLHAQTQGIAGSVATSGSAASAATARGHSRTAPSNATTVDPWKLEEHRTDIYELERTATTLGHHVSLARQAARYYQCYDAFARVAMTFGTNQLLHAINYYALGYCSVQDRAPWPAWCISAIMCGIAMALIELDLSMTKLQRLLAQVLIVAGPICSSAAATAWVLRARGAQTIVTALLPVAYASHGGWLFFASKLCRAEKQGNGSFMPTKFRPVLYLDIFGWLTHNGRHEADASHSSGGYEPVHQDHDERGDQEAPAADDAGHHAELRQSLHSDIQRWQAKERERGLSEREQARVRRLKQGYASLMKTGGALPSIAEGGREEQKASSAATSPDGGDPEAATPESAERWVKMLDYTDYGIEVEFWYNRETGEVQPLDPEHPDRPPAESSQEPQDGAPQPAAFLQARTLTESEEDLRQLVSAQEDAASSGTTSEPRRVASAQRVRRMLSERGREAVAWMNDEGDIVELSAEDAEGRALDATAAAAAYLGFWKECKPCRKSKSRGEAVDDEVPYGAQLGGGPDPDEFFDYNATFPRVEGIELMPGHKHMKPGRMPWLVFTWATSLVVLLWFLGVALPFGFFSSIVELEGMYSVPGLEAGPFGEEGGDPIPTDEAAAEEMQRLHMASIPSLPEGQLLHVGWPSHSGFEPKALTCDPSGRQLIVADDFGVYVAQLAAHGVEELSASQLRGGAAGVLPASGGIQDALLNFKRVPPCASLEGQSLKDIGVVCDDGPNSRCRVLVLHAQGRSLTECPLFELPGVGAAGAIAPMPLQPAPNSVTWRISVDWLQKGKRNERVESIAVNSDCLEGDSANNANHFAPDRMGCVVVGTSLGRVVQLRRHVTNERSLVPERAVQQRARPVEKGTLHVSQGGVVMALRPSRSLVQALDVERGSLIGEWRLPGDVVWQTLCGGGDSLYLLSHDDANQADKPKAWRFPMPAELRDRRDAAVGIQTRSEI